MDAPYIYIIHLIPENITSKYAHQTSDILRYPMDNEFIMEHGWYGKILPKATFCLR